MPVISTNFGVDLLALQLRNLEVIGLILGPDVG